MVFLHVFLQVALEHLVTLGAVGFRMELFRVLLQGIARRERYGTVGAVALVASLLDALAVTAAIVDVLSLANDALEHENAVGHHPRHAGAASLARTCHIT